MKEEAHLSQDQIDRDTAAFEAMGGTVTYYKTLDTDEIIQCMKDEADCSLWNSADVSRIKESKK